MGEERSKGVTIFAILFIIFNIWLVYFCLGTFFVAKKNIINISNDITRIKTSDLIREMDKKSTGERDLSVKLNTFGDVYEGVRKDLEADINFINSPYANISFLASLLMGLWGIVIGVGILVLKSWARLCVFWYLGLHAAQIISGELVPPKSSLFINKLTLTDCIPPLLAYFIIIYFLTRPKVKRQFTGAES